MEQVVAGSVCASLFVFMLVVAEQSRTAVAGCAASASAPFRFVRRSLPILDRQRQAGQTVDRLQNGMFKEGRIDRKIQLEAGMMDLHHRKITI
jgi:hypothetical protein